MTVTCISSHPRIDRNPDMTCWRVAAIYRCCLRLGMSKDWAVEKLREISPGGQRDHMADVWFMGIEDARRHYQRRVSGVAEPSDLDYRAAA